MDIDFALLADHAEVVGGKLYLMGGGWDTIFAREVPAPARFALALGVRIAWDETNLPTPVRIRFEDDDGQVLLTLSAEVNVGRPAHLPPGSTQLAQLAANISTRFPTHGGYRAVIEAGGDNGRPRAERTLPFRIAPPRQ